MVHVIRVKDSEVHIAVGGFRDVRVDSVDSLLKMVRDASGGTEFQIFNSQYIAGYKHIVYAALNAIAAFNSVAGVSKSVSMESMLYAACQDQISGAIELLGLKQGVHNVALLVFGVTHEKAKKDFMSIASILGVADDTVLEVDTVKSSLIMDAYDVSSVELDAVGHKEDALTWILVERGTLLRAHR